MRILTILVLVLANSVGYLNAQSLNKSDSIMGIWISPEEIAQLPTSGAAWEGIKNIADSDFGKAKGGHDDNHDVYTLAQAYVAVRLDDDTYRAKVADNVISAIGSEDNGNVLSLARNLIGYVMAADLIDFKNFDPGREAQFRTWLSNVRHKELGGQGTLISIHERRPNNFGTHATASRAAAAIYLGDHQDLERTAQIFKGWMGDRSSYSEFKFGNLSWQADPENPVGINPKGAKKHGHSIDGVLPDDQRRGGSFKWPPPKENYVYGALQGGLAAAHILNRAGYDTWNWQDKAMLRAYQWLHKVAKFPPKGDDRWQLPLVDYVYGTNYWDGSRVKNGKNMGWTDWSHNRSGEGVPNTSVSGVILNSVNNQGIPDALVQLKSGNSVNHETRTNTFGNYQFNFIEAGSYELFVSGEGFEPASQTITVTEGEQISGIDFTLTPVSDSRAPDPPTEVNVVGED
ncbi:PEGA domain-containing protein [candidate division KSB1 bacterium]|nr:PEGA domain-containing protein [candidate division KSB1 bacterium]NIR70528.1 PEGA domain-containing protein [candidate division KSB1 bacterium]NIS26201.1 PEGA domain-containing protein [candidate division KSB1 bacterium]NIT72979.1 PEGA domain-containing protein [candidate division KSB1 bacterium]NIU26848.1 PEGA domain-containing protein [candidate division KSB1 bacterium]